MSAVQQASPLTSESVDRDLRQLAEQMLCMLTDLDNGWPWPELVATLDDIRERARLLGLGSQLTSTIQTQVSIPCAADDSPASFDLSGHASDVPNEDEASTRVRQRALVMATPVAELNDEEAFPPRRDLARQGSAPGLVEDLPPEPDHTPAPPSRMHNRARTCLFGQVRHDTIAEVMEATTSLASDELSSARDQPDALRPGPRKDPSRQRRLPE